MVNLEKTLVIAVFNPDFHEQKMFALFHLQEQKNENLKVIPLWNMEYAESECGCLEKYHDSVHDLNLSDIWVFPTSLTPVQESALQNMDIEYHFYKDNDSLERLALKLGMDKMNIGFEGEPEDGSWFTCCRATQCRNILPENFHVYSLRASDEDDSQPGSIEERVVVNHFGDILTDREIPVPLALDVEEILYDENGIITG